MGSNLYVFKLIIAKCSTEWGISKGRGLRDMQICMYRRKIKLVNRYWKGVKERTWFIQTSHADLYQKKKFVTRYGKGAEEHTPKIQSSPS